MAVKLIPTEAKAPVSCADSSFANEAINSWLDCIPRLCTEEVRHSIVEITAVA